MAGPCPDNHKIFVILKYQEIVRRTGNLIVIIIKRSVLTQSGLSLIEMCKLFSLPFLDKLLAAFVEKFYTFYVRYVAIFSNYSIFNFIQRQVRCS